MDNYKISKPRYSDHYQCDVVDILKRKKIFGFITVWVYDDTIKSDNMARVNEIVMLLNNPDEVKRRLNKTK